MFVRKFWSYLAHKMLRLASMAPFPVRQPDLYQSLNVLRQSGVVVNSVLDVGIYKETRPLMKVYPDLEHHLFEPVDIYFDEIKHNYKHLKYTIYNVALSNVDGDAYLGCKSVDNSGVITHSEVLLQKPGDGGQYVKLKQIGRSRLDSLVNAKVAKPPYVLKIDVDGHEFEVLQGSVKTLKDTSVVIIEAPLQKVDKPAIFVRTEFLISQGFCLVDIVDMAYYDSVLWQVDLFFVK